MPIGDGRFLLGLAPRKQSVKEIRLTAVGGKNEFIIDGVVWRDLVEWILRNVMDHDLWATLKTFYWPNSPWKGIRKGQPLYCLYREQRVCVHPCLKCFTMKKAFDDFFGNPYRYEPVAEEEKEEIRLSIKAKVDEIKARWRSKGEENATKST